MPPGGCKRGRSGGEEGMDGKLNGNYLSFNTRAVNRGQNELIGEFKMVVGDVSSIRGRLWITCTFQQESKGNW